LVLNATFVPINICSWKRAIKLVYKGKASVLEEGHIKINGQYILPLVVKLTNYVPLPFNGVVMTRKNVYLRDNYRCQYCGKGGTLTLDHVVPRSRNGEDDWDNVVTCCVRCNNHKGDRSPEEAGLKLKTAPYKPPSTLYLHMTRLSAKPQCWDDYFFKSRN
jgi:5-methylcytosine-specific restriction endonuclease McrA